MNFNIILMNPPYDNGLHEKFLYKSLTIAETVCSIQPANFLFGNRKNANIINNVKDKHVEVEQLLNELSMFGAVIGNDLAIFTARNDKDAKFVLNGKEVDMNNLSKFVGDDKMETFNEIIKPLYSEDNLVQHMKRYDGESSEQYYVKIPKIRGHKYDGVADDFYTLISNNEKFVLNNTLGQLNDIKQGKRSKLDYYVPFDNRQTTLNFISYCKTDFFRAAFYLLKNSPNVTSGKILRYIPWFDFSNSIFSKSPKEIDDHLFKKYNISNEIRQHIEEILPDYYGIRIP